MTFSPILDVVFAHQDEDISVENCPPTGLLPRQLNRWKNRRMARFLLQQLFQKHQLDLNLLEHIQRTASGRPFVSHPQLDFNISDSGEWVAVILSRSADFQAVGIDIEQPQRVRPYTKLIQHYANQEEMDELLAENQTVLSSLQDRFYLSWCLREAVLKSQGVGIVKLSEVRHLPKMKQIFSAYCPRGILHFSTQLPFYLCYFYQDSGIIQPTVMQWQNGNLQKCADFRPLVYQVNYGV